MKLCGIMDDDDFMDTDEMQLQPPPPPPAPPPQCTTPYDIPTSLSTTQPSDSDGRSNTLYLDGTRPIDENSRWLTIPCVQNSDMTNNRVSNDAQPILINVVMFEYKTKIIASRLQAFSFTIPSVDGGNVSMASYTDATSVRPITTRPNGDTATCVSDVQKLQSTDRQYMIKIDNNDGTPPFPLSITLPHNLGSSTDGIEMNKNVMSMSSLPVTSHSNQTMPLTASSIPAPTLQSQINKIQNQLIGAQNSVPSSTHLSNTMGTIAVAANTTAISTTTLTTSSSAQKPTKKKQTTKRNNKKVMETINVPSQIGNIQVLTLFAFSDPFRSLFRFLQLSNIYIYVCVYVLRA